MTDAGVTWAGTHTFAAPQLVVARSIDEAVAAVRDCVDSGAPVRALGTRHSFNDIADTTGTLVTLTEVPADPVLDAAAHTVTVGAGTRYGILASWLEAHGWALHNMGSLPHISVAGATQTGTHGSGITNGCLTTAVRALEYIDANGDVRTVRAGDPDFPALAVGLGAFGVITRVTLAIEPTYTVAQSIWRGIGWDTLLDSPKALLSAAYSLSVFTRWGTPELEQVWVKAKVGVDPALAPDWMGGAAMTHHTLLAEGNPADLTDHDGTPGPWLTRLPHFRLDGTPSNGNEIQTEYVVDLADAAAALRAVRALAEAIDPLLLITELRTIAADELWLSGAYRRDTLAIHFTWRPLAQEVAAVLPAVEEALAPFAARPHWGKWHAFDATRLDEVHPRLGAARDVFERLDPAGRFANDHLRRLGVRAS